MSGPTSAEWRGHRGPADARRIEIYCDGGAYVEAHTATPRHPELVVASLVEVGLTLHFDGGSADWLFEDTEHTTVQVLHSPRSKLPAERPKIVCPECGEDLTIGDSLGVGYTTADQDEEWDWWSTEDAYPPWADEPTWARRSRNSVRLKQLADTGLRKLSLVGLRRILSMP